MTERMRRVNESIRQVLSERLPNLKDPRIGFVTVTGVDTAPDLRHATVYVSVLGAEKQRDRSLRGLEAAHGVLQSAIAHELKLKRTPQLTFTYDPSVERGVRMTKLIDDLASQTMTPSTTDLAAVAEAIRANDRFLLVTHENPDGDALGSILGMKFALDALGKDSVMYLPGETSPPSEYRILPLDELLRELPADAAERVLLALDCANAKRMGAAADLLDRVPLSIDVDHHHDNTRFAAVNHVVADASSTGEILRDLLRDLNVPLTPAIAEALYIALVTDTGRFQYTNTTPKALRLAAELVEAGVDVPSVFRGIYESVELAKLKLIGHALERAQVYDGGRFVASYLLRSDFQELGVGEEYAEGIIDYLRSIEGAELVATIREPPEPPDAPRRISMRASSDELDVSAIARQRGGGGHRQAAGFSSPESIEEIIEFIRSAFHAARGTEQA
jgi:phosphoesterase RecJ-like protein